MHPTRGPLGRLLLAMTALAALGAAPAARAAGTVVLKGTMVTNCGVVVDDLNATVNLTGGSTNLNVATVGEKCNDKDGYTVTVTSANGGALVNAAGTRAPYTASYSGVSGRSLATPLVLTRTKDQKSFVYRNFTVTLPPNAQLTAGSYVDTITITLAAR